MVKIKLGDKVRDKITGFEGTVTVKAEFINGCIQYKIQPYGMTKEGEMLTGEFIDEARLEILPEKNKKIKKKPTGGGFRDYPSE